MKTIKFTMLSVFLLIIILLTGELAYTRIEYGFGSQLYTVSTDKLDNEAFVSELHSLTDSDCAVIYVHETVAADLSRNIAVYYSGITENSLRNKLGISSLNFKSLFTGDCTYNFRDMQTLESADVYSDPTFYCSGSEEEVRALKERLSPYAEGISYRLPDNDRRYENVFELLWAFVIVMTLAVTVYDIFSQYKTAAVTLVLGNRLGELIVRNILTDAAGITLSFGIVSLCLSFVTAVNNNLGGIALHYGILILLNSLCYLIFYTTDIFRALRDGEPSARLLYFNYVMKAIASFGVITAAAYSVMTLSELGEDLAFYDRMKQLQGYSYIDIQPGIIPDFDDEQAYMEFRQTREYIEELNDRIYSEYEHILLDSRLMHMESVEAMNESKSVVYADINAFDMLSESIGELTEADRQGTLLLIPDDADENDTALLREELETYEYDYLEKSYSKENVLVLNSNEVERFCTVGSPFIIYSSEERIKELSGSSEKTIKISDDEYEHFISKYGKPEVDFYRTDVFGNFMHYKGAAQTLSVILLLSLVCAVLFETVLTASILTLEYKVNAKEICVRRILGAHMLDRNKRLSMLTVFTDLLGAVGSYIMLKRFRLDNAALLAVVTALLLIADTAIVLIKANRIEKVNTAKILKGGAL